MKILVYHCIQYHTAQRIIKDLKADGSMVKQLVVEGSETLAWIEALKDNEDDTLYILQPEDHAFFYTCELLKAVYYTWEDRTRLIWVQPSHFTEPQP